MGYYKDLQTKSRDKSRPARPILHGHHGPVHLCPPFYWAQKTATNTYSDQDPFQGNFPKHAHSRVGLRLALVQLAAQQRPANDLVPPGNIETLPLGRRCHPWNSERVSCLTFNLLKADMKTAEGFSCPPFNHFPAARFRHLKSTHLFRSGRRAEIPSQ